MALEADTIVALSLAQMVTLTASIVGPLLAAIWVLLKVALRGLEGNIEKRFAAIEGEAETWRALERSFMTLRAELPEKFVRREDYIRGQTVIEAKLDSIASELKLVQIQGAKRER